MKKTLCALIVLVCALASFVQADQIKTKFSSPFHNLNVDTAVWFLQYSDKSEIEFELIVDSNVEFYIVQGRPVKEMSYAELVKQFKKAKGNLGKVALLKTSFPGFGDADDDEMQIDNWVETEVNGIRGIKFYTTITVEHCIYSNNEQPVCSQRLDPAVCYFFVVENRIYLISFEAPQDKFHTLEPIFADTLQGLWQ